MRRPKPARRPKVFTCPLCRRPFHRTPTAALECAEAIIRLRSKRRAKRGR